MEKYFQIRLLDLCLTQLMGRKSLTSVHGDPQYTSMQAFAGWWRVFIVQTLEAAGHRTVTGARLKKRQRFLRCARSRSILSKSIRWVLIETILFE